MANLRIRMIERIFFHYGKLKSYPPNKMILIKGDVADKIAFIKSGQVRAVVINPDGDEITLFYLRRYVWLRFLSSKSRGCCKCRNDYAL